MKKRETNPLHSHSLKGDAKDMAELLKKPEKSQRPVSSAYWQQRLTSWDPVLTPFSIITLLIVLGLILVPSGVVMLNGSNTTFDLQIQYGGEGTAQTLKDVLSPNNIYKDEASATVDFTLESDLDGPLYLYYQITNYHQNNIKYSSSVNWNQMQGQKMALKDLKVCEPADKTSDDVPLNPCGLISSSFFTDGYAVTKWTRGEESLSTLPVITTDDITGPLDKSLFAKPKGYKELVLENTCGCTNSGTVTTGCSTISTTPHPDGTSSTWKCYSDPSCQSSNQCATAYYYPDEDNNQYLYEQYPGIISPLKGVEDPHFMNWMNIAALPTFRKLYGVIKPPSGKKFKANDVITFMISQRPSAANSKGTSAANVAAFKGTKSLVLSADGALGVKNPGLGVTYIVSGSCMLLAAIVFFIKHEIWPRPLGSPAVLNWRQE